METVSYTSLRENLSKIMEKITDDSVAYTITRKGHEPVVMMAQSDYSSIMETMYLLSNPTNAQELLSAIREADEGKFVEWKP